VTPKVPDWLSNHGALLLPGDLPPHLAIAHANQGARMMAAEMASVTLTGTVTDSRGTHSAQIVVAAPGYFAYRETSGRTVTFNENGFQAPGGLSALDDPLIESLLAHLPDAVFLQVASGGAYRRIGSHFRPDGGTTLGYSGPFWSMLAFSPRSRPGLGRGKALQQELFIAVDESTGLLAEVRVVVKTGGQLQVTQTDFQNWKEVQPGQWFPATIARYENKIQTLVFQLQGAVVSAAPPASAYVP
jgi:hypothetical protein